MSGHALFSPSAAHRWIECPGSFSYPQNTGDEESSSAWADNGTASHHWAALCLKSGEDAEYFIDTEITINGAVYKMDEERAGFVQMYLDKVRELANGGILYVEHWVDLSEYTGEGQGGTADAAIIVPQRRLVIAADLKYGVGEKVDASYIENGKRLPNHQAGLYGLGVEGDARLMGYEIDTALLVIVQPRLAHVDEQEFTMDELRELGKRASVAAGKCAEAMVFPPAEMQRMMYPGKKTCRWCRAQAECPKLAAQVQEEVRNDFEDIPTGGTPPLERDAEALGRAFAAVPLIEQWCKAVRAEVKTAVGENRKIIGTDGKPLKFVAGEMGDRKWINADQAEAALLDVLGPEKTYQPRKVITAPQAGKLLNKKATKAMWEDGFQHLITRAPGRPVLALGSDPRPAFTGAADAGEFEDETDLTV